MYIVPVTTGRRYLCVVKFNKQVFLAELGGDIT